MALENYNSITRLNLMQAFEAAWAAACKVEASIMMVPAESVFLVGPMSFSGPYCQANIIFQVKSMEQQDGKFKGYILSVKELSNEILKSLSAGWNNNCSYRFQRLG